MNKMEKKKDGKEESPIPMLILMAIILLGGILLAGLIIFSE
jgi:cytoskeletal protein RodZ